MNSNEITLAIYYKINDQQIKAENKQKLYKQQYQHYKLCNSCETINLQLIKYFCLYSFRRN